MIRYRNCPILFINGFKFHTTGFGANKTTYNSGVCVTGGNECNDLEDYYGVLQEIIELTYSMAPELKLFLFKCDWFDTRKDIGIRRAHKNYPLIEVNHKRRIQGYDPFVLATQATQVYYAPYPAMNNSKADWWAVVKTKPRWSFNLDTIIIDDQPYQHDLNPNEVMQIIEDADDIGPLNNEVFSGVELDEDVDDQVDDEGSEDDTDLEVEVEVEEDDFEDVDDQVDVDS